jgi:hypothetical protein
MLLERLASGRQLREVRRPFLLLPISLLWQAPPAALPLPLISFLVVFSLKRLSVVRGFPTCFGCLARDLRPPLLALGLRPGLPAPPAKRDGSRVLLDPRDVNGVADHISAPLLALWSSRHSC